MIERVDFRRFDFNEARKVLQDKIVVFTGRGFTVRWELAQFAKNSGARVEGTVTKRTDLLIVGEKPGSKLNKARKYGCEIISIEDYYNILIGKNIKLENVYDVELTIEHLSI